MSRRWGFCTDKIIISSLSAPVNKLLTVKHSRSPDGCWLSSVSVFLRTRAWLLSDTSVRLLCCLCQQLGWVGFDKPGRVTTATKPFNVTSVVARHSRAPHDAARGLRHSLPPRASVWHRIRRIALSRVQTLNRVLFLSFKGAAFSSSQTIYDTVCLFLKNTRSSG